MFHPDGPSFIELARQALSSTSRGYDLLADKFDVTPFRTPEPIIEATLEAAAREAGPAERGLDLCCGTGAGLAALQRRCRRSVTGVDFSRGMLDVAARRLDLRRPVPIRLVEADVLELRLDERFELVTCFGALGHILAEDEPRLLATIRHHLRPEGASPSPPPRDRPGGTPAACSPRASTPRCACATP